MKNVMMRAWEIYRTLKGDHIAKLSLALKLAWEEEKMADKMKFDGYVEMEIEACGNTTYTFKLWEKADKKRIYVTYRGKRQIGYIDCKKDNSLAHIDDCKAYRDACQEFLNAYEIA